MNEGIDDFYMWFQFCCSVYKLKVLCLPESRAQIGNLTFIPLQADLCVPRLNEGDQVVLINGRDVAGHTHDQVVLLIKASCERHSGELVLLVRPNGECSVSHWMLLQFLHVCD